MNFEDRIDNPWNNIAKPNYGIMNHGYSTMRMSYGGSPQEGGYVTPDVARNPVTKDLVVIPRGQNALNPIGTPFNTYRERKPMPYNEAAEYADPILKSPNYYKNNPNLKQYMMWMDMRGNVK